MKQRANLTNFLNCLFCAHFGQDGFLMHSKSYKLQTDEGTFPGAGALSSRDLAHLVDLSELCLW